MAFPQFAVVGTVSYILKCPKAPGEHCDPASACDGHEYLAQVSLYVEAPDAERAEQGALRKVSSAYPFPLFDQDDCVVNPVEPSTPTRHVPAGDLLPGFAGAYSITGTP